MSILRKITAPFRRIWIVAAILVTLACLTAVRLFFASNGRRRAEDNLGTPPLATKTPAKSATSLGSVSEPVTANFGGTISNFVLPPESSKRPQAKEPPPIPDEIKRQLVNPLTAISLF